MELSRRGFLHTGSKVGLVALISGAMRRIAFGQEASFDSGIGNVIPRGILSDPLFNITRAMFTESVNTRFKFKLGPVRLGNMVLDDVEDMNPTTHKNTGTSVRDCFSLVFRGPADLLLQLGTYTVGHGKLGTFNLFIVPGENAITGQRYTAILNRLYP